MSFFANVSYVGLLAATCAGMMVGFVWYSDLLFVKPWMKHSKISQTQIESSNMTLTMLSGVSVTFAITLCLAFMFHYFASAQEAFFALWFLILFVAIESLGILIWEKAPLQLYLINVGHKAVSWTLILLTYILVFGMAA